jgi:hypothetical protein
MIRMFLASLALLLATVATAQQSPEPSSPTARPAAGSTPAARPDPTDPRMRDVPMRCKPGDVDVAKGRTLGQIFGAEWPASPAVPAARRTAAQVVSRGRVDWPAASGPATAASAVLVDAQGRVLRAQVLCASNAAAVALVEAASLQGTYRAAMFDGAPSTGVVIVSWRLGTPPAGR